MSDLSKAIRRRFASSPDEDVEQIIKRYIIRRLRARISSNSNTLAGTFSKDDPTFGGSTLTEATDRIYEELKRVAEEVIAAVDVVDGISDEERHRIVLIVLQGVVRLLLGADTAALPKRVLDLLIGWVLNRFKAVKGASQLEYNEGGA